MTVTRYDLPARALQPSAAHHNRAPLACAALALALALTACGGSTKPSSNTASVSSGSSAISGTSTAPSSAGTSGGGATSRVGSDVCSLVSAAEAQAVVGESLKPGVPVKGTIRRRTARPVAASTPTASKHLARWHRST